MAIGDVHRVTYDFTNVNLPKGLSTGFHVQQDGIAFSDQDVFDAAYQLWIDIDQLYSTDITLTGITLQRISPPEAIIRTDGGNTYPAAGTAAVGTNLPPNAAVLVSLRTALVGRRYRGRMFLPPVSEVDSNGNLLTTSAETIRDAMQNLIDVLNGVGVVTPMVIWSEVGGFANEVTQVRVDRRFRSQRRRQTTPVYVS